jgi:UDP-glucose 4-epimerase
MRALITGGAGFIGSHLTEALLHAGHQVTVIDDLSTGRFENIQHLTALPHFRFAIETITNEAVMDRFVSECDVIFHLAAAVGVELIIQSPVRVIQTNILGTEAVLNIANRYRRKVLLASTSEVYGKNDKLPFKEDDDSLLGPTTKSRWCYSVTKAVDEFLALAYYRERQLPVVILRFFNTVGTKQTGQYGMVVPRFIKMALTNEPITIYGDGQQSRCFCNVADTVRAIINLSENPDALGEVFNVGSTEEVTIEQLAIRIKELTGSQSEITYIPYDEAYEAGFEDMRRRIPDTTKIHHLTGWEPRYSLDVTLKQIIEDYRERLGLVSTMSHVLPTA